jgi:hypothetical protein
VWCSCATTCRSALGLQHPHVIYTLITALICTSSSLAQQLWINATHISSRSFVRHALAHTIRRAKVLLSSSQLVSTHLTWKPTHLVCTSRTTMNNLCTVTFYLGVKHRLVISTTVAHPANYNYRSHRQIVTAFGPQIMSIFSHYLCKWYMAMSSGRYRLLHTHSLMHPAVINTYSCFGACFTDVQSMCTACNACNKDAAV